MHLTDALGAAGTVGGLISVACSVYVATRDARWRKSGMAAQFDARITRAERWWDSTEAKAIVSQIDQNANRIQRCESQLEGVATKVELAHVEGAISRVEGVVRDAAAGVDRIEGMLMKKALGA